MSTSSGPKRGSTGSGISALRPLPRAGRLSIEDRFLAAEHAARFTSRDGRRTTLEHFAREIEIRFGAARFWIVSHHRQTVARGFAESDVARDHSTKDFLFEESAHIIRDLMTEIRALIAHREQHAVDVE